MITIPTNKPKNLQAEISVKALELWNKGEVKNASSDNTITILDEIGESWWSEGVTAKRIAGALRSIGADKDVEVIINSAGGDVFEGIAIYNLLKEHKGKVTVKIVGLAASAASIIALAGDEVQVAKAGFIMIHNAWVVGAGNRHDFRAFADYLEPFDDVLASVYIDQTGLDKKEIQSMMDNETWLNGDEAIAKGFADALLDSDLELDEPKEDNIVAHRFDTVLAKAGMSRSDRRKMIKDFKASISTQIATRDDMRDAIKLDLKPLPKIKI